MNAEQITSKLLAARGLPDWRVLHAALETRYRTGKFDAGLALLNAIGEAAERAGHHPDLTLSYTHLGVVLSSHDVGAVTERDINLAREISRLAREAGVVAEPGSLQRLEVALDTWDIPGLRRFWSAVLGLTDEVGPADEITDPSRRLPTLWFQQTTVHPEPRQRFHYDLWVPPEVAPERIKAALAAGGRLVTDRWAPSYWVLADPQGNKVCICTDQGRDD